MALTKIRRANKKWSREARRKKRRNELRLKSTKANLGYKKQRKLILQQRRETLEHREHEISYVNNLKDKVLDEEKATS